MNVKRLTLGNYATNCYILWKDSENRCLLIDPGYEPEEIWRNLRALGLNVDAILLTHGHFDHVGAVRPLAEATGCAVYLCEKDLSLPEELTAGPLYNTDSYEDGEEMTLAGLTFRVLETPGHTPGSVCLLFGDQMFSGDTLFAGSCGRVDFPGGDGRQMELSLARLRALPGNFEVHPGHGPETTLDDERRMNPYLKGAV